MSGVPLAAGGGVHGLRRARGAAVATHACGASCIPLHHRPAGQAVIDVSHDGDRAVLQSQVDVGHIAG